MMRTYTEADVGKIVHARLDEESERILDRLRRRTGLRDSAVIRRALREMDAGLPAPAVRKISGLGKFASGVPDLGSNKKHLRGFGRS